MTITNVKENEEQPRGFAVRIFKEYYDRMTVKQLRRCIMSCLFKIRIFNSTWKLILEIPCNL